MASPTSLMRVDNALKLVVKKVAMRKNCSQVEASRSIAELIEGFGRG